MRFRSVLAVSILLFSLAPYEAVAAVKSGGTCSKSGLTSISAGKKFTCTKIKGKLIWNSGKLVNPSPVISIEKLPVSLQTELSNPAECKIKLGKNMPKLSNSISFPRPTVKGNSLSPKVLVVGFSFNDASAVNIPQNELKNITDQVSKFYSEQSFGKANLQFSFTPIDSIGVPQKISFDRSIESERLLRGGGPVDFPKFLRELFDNSPANWNLHEYDAVLFYPTDRRSRIGVSTQHSPESESNAAWEKPINTKSGEIWAAVVASPDVYTFAHELGHGLFRFYDLYSQSESGSSAYTRGLDLMSGGRIFGPVTKELDFLSWHKWLAGWISDEQTRCLTENGTTNHSISDLMAADGKPKHIVAPINASKAVVIEVRTGNPIIYTVDTSISTGKIPVRVSSFNYTAGSKNTLSIEGISINVNACDKSSCNFSVSTKGLSISDSNETSQVQNSAIGISIKEMSATGTGKNSGEIIFGSENVKSYLINVDPKEGTGVSWTSGIKENTSNRTVVSVAGLTCGITYKTTLTVNSQSNGGGESQVVVNEGQLRTDPCN